MFTRSWTEAETAYIKERYPIDGAGPVALVLDRSIRAIQHRANSLRLKRLKLYKTNHTFFDDWSPHMAYILGFVITDGCVSRGRLSFGVAEKDRVVLDYIANNICPGREVATYEESRKGKRLRTCRLKVGSVRMLSRLAELGVAPRKTGNEVLPEVPEAYKADLLRGLFDGDGCVYVCNRRTGQLALHVTSASAVFLEAVRNTLGMNFGKVTREVGKNFHRWNVYRQDHIRNLGEFMYYPGHFFGLTRKMEKFRV